MADSIQRHGRDTWVGATKPDAQHTQTVNLRVQSSESRVYVFQPMPGIRGKTIESATLTCPAKGSWASQTLTVTPVDENWAPRKTTWNNQPAVRSGEAITSAQSSKTDGERIEVDVTAFVQSIADGARNYGLRITTGSSADNRLYAFNSTHSGGAWVLTIDFAEAPEIPTDLAPNGSVTAVKPVVTFDFTDLGGESTELGAVQVRVNTSASTSGAWTSSETATTVPEFNLDGTWSTTPTSGVTYYWQVRVRDGAGCWSGWSDWASFTYVPKPTLTLDNPSTGIVWDPTPTIAAHISAGTIAAWRIRIARGSDKSRVLYDSGKQPTTGSDELAHTVPFKDDRGRRILKDDVAYWLNVRVWDRNDRQPTPGDTAWVEDWTQFTFDDDATPPPPTDLAAFQIGDTPRVRLTWYRATGYPEGWVIIRDDEVIARLDPDEVDVNDDLYEWTDPTAAPWVAHEYTVKVIDGEKQSVASPVAYVTPEVGGVWLLSDDGDVRIAGTEVGNLKTVDHRATYSPMNLSYDVDVVYAFAGVAGSFEGSIDDRTDQDAMDARAVLIGMKGQPHQEVQLVYGSMSVPVKLSNVSVLPSSEFRRSTRQHDVSFDAQQTSDFEVDV